MIRFFDDTPLEMIENMTRDYEHPKLIEDSKYRDPSNYSICGALPSVFFNEALGEYMMIYTILEPESIRVLQCAAHSADGAHWEPLDTTKLVEYEDRRLFNQAFPLCEGEGWVYQDKRAEPAERYKMFYFRYCLDTLTVSDELFVSPDALHWTKLDVTWNENGGEPGVGCVYSSLRQSYIITCRPHWCDRRICITETKDWRTFTTPVHAMQADALDEPLAEIYGMPVFEVEDRYVGFAWKILEPNGACKQEMKGQLVSLGGHMAPELVYSDNGLYYMRSLRKPFIENGDPDCPCYGCLFTSSMLQRDENTWLITAAASQGGHGGFRTPGIGSILTFAMKPDRFIYLQSNALGLFRTMHLLVDGDIYINAHVYGSLRFQLVDFDGTPIPGFTFADCDRFCGNELKHKMTWKGRSASELKGQIVKLECTMDSGRLYTVSGVTVPGFNQVRRYRAFGALPKEPLVR